MILFVIAAAFVANSNAPSTDIVLSDYPADVILAQVDVRIQRHSIVRVPPATVLIAEPQIKWKEKGAPNCIRWGNMAAAMVSSSSSVDLIIRGGTRYRVRLEKSCQAVDFYSGFYVKLTPDGNICKNRDMIHSRAGGACSIARFRTLVPAK